MKDNRRKKTEKSRFSTNSEFRGLTREKIKGKVFFSCGIFFVVGLRCSIVSY